MKKGLQITYKDNTTEYYAPITDFKETAELYTFYVGRYDYEIDKEAVSSIREYECCKKCGHEVFYDGCRRCYMEEELKQLKDDSLL
jgi:hypothetical protein